MSILSFTKEVGDKIFHRESVEGQAKDKSTDSDEPSAQGIAHLLLKRI